ncbi:MAG: hypothetical protein HY795_07275, partial [Desulfovibrio sp.]|nr:hypothetical protein [Desulfovibrio sp.]MBI4960795.1 hypothetical protein [Desulfovibrio sp.]
MVRRSGMTTMPKAYLKKEHTFECSRFFLFLVGSFGLEISGTPVETNEDRRMNRGWASLSATQNRLSNTIQNLQIKAENLQAAESRISDVDVSQEMTTMVSNQILAQSAAAMLDPANSFDLPPEVVPLIMLVCTPFCVQAVAPRGGILPRGAGWPQALEDVAPAN